MKRAVFALLAACALAAPAPARAIVVVEETWRAQGGAELHWEQGFARHEALAAEPQFRAMVSLSQDGGESFGVASGVWIGNDSAHGYILTAAHVLDHANAKETLARTTGGAILHGVRAWVHPRWLAASERAGGFDFAILQVDARITDSGTQPTLYSGDREAGHRCVLVGYGLRGVAPFGHGERFGRDHGMRAAAAENVVDRVTPMALDAPRHEGWGNVLSIDLDQPNGPGKNRFGAVAPVSALEGVLAPGDSGGSLWMRFAGGWRIVGVNSSGDPGADYQDISNFARVSQERGWIALVFPGARFAP